MRDNDNKQEITPTKVRHAEVTEGEAGQRVDNFLLRRAPGVPRSHVYQVIRKGQVRVNGGRVKPTRKLLIGDVVRIPPMSLKRTDEVHVPDSLAETLCARIVFEHEDFFAIDKPHGLAVHGGSGLAFGAIDALRQGLQQPQLELVHRLDRGTSGCLLIARNNGTNRLLQDLFRGRAIAKRYLALLDGQWQHGDLTVDVKLEKNKELAGERRVIVSDNGQTAVSHFSLVEQFKGAALLQVAIETGRTHQIRVHAKHVGHPVVGDTRYGDNAHNTAFRQTAGTRMYLHAQQLTFEWKGKTVTIDVPIDEQWSAAQAQLSAL